MPMVFIRHVGANLAFIHPIEGPVDPGFGLGGRPGGGVDPGWGIEEGGRPGQLPSGGWPGHPSQGLPRPPRPPHVAPGQTLILVRDPVGVWHYRTIDASTPPPKPLPPGTPGAPDQGLPPGTPLPEAPDQGLPQPPTAAPKPV